MHRLHSENIKFPIFSAKLVILGGKSRNLYFKVNMKFTLPMIFVISLMKIPWFHPTYDFRFKIAILEFWSKKNQTFENSGNAA